MHNKDTSYTLLKDTAVVKTEHLKKGQKIMFEGEEADLIRVTPFLVIQTKSGIVCGNLRKILEHIKE